MIPILYEKNEKEFVTLGLGVLNDCISCLVTEERNGTFSLKMQYPADGVRFSEIRNERIIVVDASRELPRQRFVIVRITRPLQGVVTVYGEHIAQYITKNTTLQPRVPFQGTAQQALSTWNRALVSDERFHVSSNIALEKEGVWTIDAVENARRALGGVEGSILDNYGGEYRFNNMHIELLQSRGVDRNVVIAYGKNITNLEDDEDITDIATSIQPFASRLVEGTNGEQKEVIITLPEVTIDTANVDHFARKKTVVVDFTGDEVTNVEQLRSVATCYVKNGGLGVPKNRLKVSFVDLLNTLEYKDRALVELIELCDWVYVYFPQYDIRKKTKVIKTVWDVLLDQYESIELGTQSNRFSSSIPTVDGLKSQVEQSIAKRIPSILDAGRKAATELINQGFGGYVRVYNDRILILDDVEEEKARRVWQWNKNGLGYSASGIQGPYVYAWTIDGALNTAFIGTNSITVNHLAPDVGRMLNISGNVAILGLATKEELKDIELTPGPQGDPGLPGKDGKDGASGKDGVGVREVLYEYASSTSAETPPASGWGRELPNVDSKIYVWTRVQTIYTDGHTEISTPQCMTSKQVQSALEEARNDAVRRVADALDSVRAADYADKAYLDGVLSNSERAILQSYEARMQAEKEAMNADWEARLQSAVSVIESELQDQQSYLWMDGGNLCLGRKGSFTALTLSPEEVGFLVRDKRKGRFNAENLLVDNVRTNILEIREAGSEKGKFQWRHRKASGEDHLTLFYVGGNDHGLS
ncbi:phage tail spike protein [Peptoniphilaceae bacterium SGI.097]